MDRAGRIKKSVGGCCEEIWREPYPKLGSPRQKEGWYSKITGGGESRLQPGILDD